MPIDVFSETVLTFAEATKRLPRLRSGKKVHVATLYRWAWAGRRAADGATVRLQTIKVGGTTCTSLEALQRFFDSLTKEVQAATPPPITSRQRLKQIQQAEEGLRRAGF